MLVSEDLDEYGDNPLGDEELLGLLMSYQGVFDLLEMDEGIGWGIGVERRDLGEEMGGG